MIIFWLSFLHYYTRFTGFLAYLYFFKQKIKLTYVDIIAILCIILLHFLHFFNGKSWLNIVIDFRFWWGWLLFYLILKDRYISAHFISNALVALSFIVLLETILINTIIDPWMLPNFPENDGGVGEYNAVLTYQRPYAFGASATVGSCLIVALMALSRVRGWRLWLAVFVVFIFVSGTGILALMLLILIRYKVLVLKSLIPVFLTIFSCYYLLPELFNNAVFELSRKVGFEYINILFWIKLNQLYQGFADLNNFELFFGVRAGGRGGDFGGLLFILSNGVLGALLLFMITFSRMNKVNTVPLILLLVTSLHYPVIFFVPGQMVFGLLLGMKYKNI